LTSIIAISPCCASVKVIRKKTPGLIELIVLFFAEFKLSVAISDVPYVFPENFRVHTYSPACFRMLSKRRFLSRPIQEEVSRITGLLLLKLKLF